MQTQKHFAGAIKMGDDLPHIVRVAGTTPVFYGPFLTRENAQVFANNIIAGKLFAGDYIKVEIIRLEVPPVSFTRLPVGPQNA